VWTTPHGRVLFPEGSRPVDDARIAEPARVAECLQFAHDAMPLLDWGWAAVEWAA